MFTPFAIQRDRKILIGGGHEEYAFSVDPLPRYTYSFIIRLNEDGTRDDSFGDHGTVVRVFHERPDWDYMIYNIIVQSDDKILAVGSENIARLNYDGSYDTEFGRDGIVREYAYPSVALQQDRKIVLGISPTDEECGGRYGWTLKRLNENGGVDVSFMSADRFRPGISPACLPRSESLGGLGAFLNNLMIQPDGKIITGNSSVDYRMPVHFIRNNSEGSIDTGFHNAEDRLKNPLRYLGDTRSFGFGAGLLSDGKILRSYSCAGQCTDVMDPTAAPYRLLNITTHDRFIGIFRYNSDGSRDETFGEHGVIQIPAYDPSSNTIKQATSMKVQANDNILLTGEYLKLDESNNIIASHRYLLRLHSDGSPDTSFGLNGEVMTTTATFELSSAAAIEERAISRGRPQPPITPLVQVKYCSHKIVVAGMTSSSRFDSRYGWYDSGTGRHYLWFRPDERIVLTRHLLDNCSTRSLPSFSIPFLFPSYLRGTGSSEVKTLPIPAK